MGGGRRIQPRGARFRLTGAYSGHGAPNSAKGAGIGASRPVAAMVNGVGSGRWVNRKMGFWTPPTDKNLIIQKAGANLSNGGAIWVPSP